MFINFLCNSLFCIMYHNILPDLTALRSDLEEPNKRMEVFCFTYNSSVNWWSDLLALVFLSVTDGPGDIGLL